MIIFFAYLLKFMYNIDIYKITEIANLRKVVPFEYGYGLKISFSPARGCNDFKNLPYVRLGRICRVCIGLLNFCWVKLA